MTNSGKTNGRPLRLWPGIIAVVLLGLARFGIKAVVPGFAGFSQGMQGAIAAALAVVLWWAFFSRAVWFERWGAIVLMAFGLSVAWLIRHETMGPLWLIGYAVPVLCLAFVSWAVATRRLPDAVRRATMVATILLACVVWSLVRTDGINGDHVAAFGWRWALSPEERLLAQAGAESAALGPAPVASVPSAPAGAAPAVAAVLDGSKSPPVARAGDTPGAFAPAPESVVTGMDWPGFRGARRDGIVPGVRIETDWSRSRPAELWRRPVGPGWSSFAARGDAIYTQEQRGDDEVVASYRAATGQPVWAHRDAARFFESNGGAGPRATPALGNGRVYTFGATGILNALDDANGAVVWSRNVVSDTGRSVPNWGFASSPLVADDLVIVAAAGRLVAYDLDTGKLRWTGPAGSESYSSPHLVALDGIAQILLMSGDGVISIALSEGKRLWDYAWRGFPIVQPALIENGDLLIAISAESGTRRIAAALASGVWRIEERWASIALKPYFNDFVVHKGYAFGFDGRILACIDLADGTRKWKGGRYGNGQLILLADQDLLLVLSEEGELALVGATPDQFREFARIPALEGKTWNHPVLANDLLLVRNGREMAAFRLPLEARSPVRR